MLAEEIMKIIRKPTVSQAGLHSFAFKITYPSLAITILAQFGDYFSTLQGLNLGLAEADRVAAAIGQETDLALRLAFSLFILLPLYLLARKKQNFLLDGFASILSIVMPILTVGIVLWNLALSGVI